MEWLAKRVKEASIEIASFGGHPDDVMILGPCLVVATLDADGAPQLHAFGPDEAMEWYRGIRRSMRDEPGESVAYHVEMGFPVCEE